MGLDWGLGELRVGSLGQFSSQIARKRQEQWFFLYVVCLFCTWEKSAPEKCMRCFNFCLGVLSVPPPHLDRSWTNQRVIRTVAQEYGYKHVPFISKMDAKKKHIARSYTKMPPQ